MEATVEREIERVVARYHREQQGHSPDVFGVTVLPDMVVIRCRDIFTPTERELVKTVEGRKLVQSARREQRAHTRRQAEAAVAEVIGRGIVRSFFDLDVRVGEQAEIYVFE
ncbi:DUF2294 domain-containing protein [bacterium]|nr:MAG: DUF2294 domain-containing protein [bacterium]